MSNLVEKISLAAGLAQSGYGSWEKVQRPLHLDSDHKHEHADSHHQTNRQRISLSSRTSGQGITGRLNPNRAASYQAHFTKSSRREPHTLSLSRC